MRKLSKRERRQLKQACYAVACKFSNVRDFKALNKCIDAFIAQKQDFDSCFERIQNLSEALIALDFNATVNEAVTDIIGNAFFMTVLHYAKFYEGDSRNGE